jgi:hypothetical protein
MLIIEQMDKDDLEDLDTAETGLSRPNSWQMMMMTMISSDYINSVAMVSNHTFLQSLLVLQAFQIQVLKWASNSCSSPEQAWFRQILLAVNNITRGNSRSVSTVKAFKSLSLGRKSINCQVDRSFAAQCSWVKPETYAH